MFFKARQEGIKVQFLAHSSRSNVFLNTPIFLFEKGMVQWEQALCLHTTAYSKPRVEQQSLLI